jgi:hypothetical protein
MMLVVSIIGLIAAIAFPSFTAGLESVRLTAASDAIASFLNGGLARADRRQQMIEIAVSIPQNSLTMRSTEPGFIRTMKIPDGITLIRVLPPLPNGAEETERVFYIYPAGAIPAIGIEIANSRGKHRVLRIEPTSGVAQTEDSVPGQQQ